MPLGFLAAAALPFLKDPLEGATGGLFDILGGRDVPRAALSGAFQQVPQVGGAFSSLLLERLRRSPGDTQSFDLLSESLRESLGRISSTQRQRLGDTAQARGFLDSGAVLEGLSDIDRAELEAFASGIRDILLALEERRTADVLPFLSAAAGEATNINQLNIEGALGERGQNLGLLQSYLGFLAQT